MVWLLMQIAHLGQLLGCPAGAVSALTCQVDVITAVRIRRCIGSCSCAAAAPTLSHSCQEGLAGEGEGRDVQALPEDFSEPCVPHHVRLGAVLLG